MAGNYAQLLDIINNPTDHSLPAWDNNNKLIEGLTVKQYLLTIINSLTVGYQFMGVASTNTSGGTPDQNVFYIAGAGTYTGFGSNPITIDAGYIGIIRWNGVWSSDTIWIANVVSVSQNTLNTENKAVAINVGGTDYNITDENAQQKIGYDVIFEQGSINYLTGADLQDDKGIRTSYIKCNKDTLLKLQFGKVVTLGYIIKYLGSTYVGYTSFTINDSIAVINVTADSTFDKIRVRINSSADWTTEEIEGSKLIVSNSNSLCEQVMENTQELSKAIKYVNILATPNVNEYTRMINSCIRALYLPYIENGYKISVLRRNDDGIWSVKIYTSDLSNQFNFTWNSSPEDVNGMTYAFVKDNGNTLGVCYIIIDWNRINNGTSYTSLTSDTYKVSNACYDKNSFAEIGIMLNSDSNAITLGNIENYKNEIGRYIFFEKGGINYQDGSEFASDRMIRSYYISFDITSRLLIFSNKWFGSIRVIRYNGISTTPVSSESISLSNGRLIDVLKDNTFDRIRIRIDATTDWDDKEIADTYICIFCSPSINELHKDVIKSNLYPDPLFVLPQYNGMNGIWVDYHNPQLTQIENGCVFAKNSSTSAKGMFIEMRMTPQWLIEHGFTDGQTLTIGAEMRADVNVSANITAYGFSMREESLTTEKSLVFSFERRYIPIANKANDWQNVMTKVVVKNISTAYQYYYVTLAYMQVTDIGATELAPDVLYVKRPWIAIGDKVFEFTESCDGISTRVVNTKKIITEQLELGYEQTEIKRVFSVESQKNTARWVELSDNFAFPSVGTYIGRLGNDVYLSIDGVLTKLNN